MGPLALGMIVMRGLTCHRVVLSVCMSGVYLAAFLLWVMLGNLGNLLWQ